MRARLRGTGAAARSFWRRLPRWVRASIRTSLAIAVAAVVAAGVPVFWAQARATGHVYSESDLAGGSGPQADVVIVLGAQIAPGGTQPMPFLQGRLDTAATLLATGHGKVVLVSGDASGGSGDETAVMTDYLVNAGVDPARVVADPYGLDTYDTCVRARQVYGVRRALVVTQSYHVARAVTLCRHAGIDADGIVARCDGCQVQTVAANAVREYFACSKAAWDAWRDRPPAVTSPPSSEIADALERLRTGDR
ncbi:MAG TPA: YdcF family protein [Micromonosporaceae bacterium]|jgi:vancomycin permeability regulator SanA